MTPAASNARTDEARHVFAAIVGTGFSGFAAAIELKKAGIDDIVLFERASSLGGTWRDNRYPGCACDVPSHLYSFSFAPKATWSRAFSPHDEIRAYLEKVADDFDLRRHLVFDKTVEEAVWDASKRRWHLRMKDGERVIANVVISAVGALSNPSMPALPGMARFRGRQFHSAEWDASYDMRGKRVGVVGTGASAIQIIPAIQPEVARLSVFQRTPPWVVPRFDREFGPLARGAFRFAPGARWLYRQAIYWSLELRVLAFEHPGLMRMAERDGRKNIEKSISDEKLRAIVTPTYRAGCKRILVSDDYYPALARSNVEVVTAGIESVTESGVVVKGGRAIELDAIVYGTGFRVHDYLAGFTVRGTSGASLREVWKNGAEAYFGTVVSGFPNFFVMTGPNTGLGHNSMVVMIEGQARFVRKAIELMKSRGAETLEVKREAQAAFNEWLHEKLKPMVWESGCQSWYLDAAGRNTTIWPGMSAAFRAKTSRVRAADFLVGG